MKNQTSKQELYSSSSAVCELFGKAKKAAIRIGRKHKVLRYTIMAASMALVITTVLGFTIMYITASATELTEDADNRKLQNGRFEEGQT